MHTLKRWGARLWEWYKEFCRKCRRHAERSRRKFGWFRSHIGVAGAFLLWLFCTPLILELLAALYLIPALWWLAKAVVFCVCTAVNKVFRTDIPCPSLSFSGDSAKMSGEEYEKYVADRLAEKGFYNIRLTPSSGDYGVDILAEKGGVKYAFQCKRYSSPVGVKAVQEVYAGCRKYCMEQPVVVTNSSFTPNAKTLADDLGVSLWELEMFDAIF